MIVRFHYAHSLEDLKILIYLMYTYNTELVDVLPIQTISTAIKEDQFLDQLALKDFSTSDRQKKCTCHSKRDLRLNI